MSTALDFRDIRQHPPAASKAGEPLPADPSWDAHKVYFNEREKGVGKKGDEFDDLFAKEKAGCGRVKEFVGPNPSETEVKNKDETLDPLGWPVDAFRSIGSRVSSLLVGAPTNNFGDEDDGEEDNINLIRKSDEEEPSMAATWLTSLGMAENTKAAEQIVQGVQNMFLFGSSTTQQQQGQAETQDDVVMDKEQRIKMYETTGIDDESSVEEDDKGDEEEDWDKDQEVGYVVQSNSNDEDDLDEGRRWSTAVAADFDPVDVAAVPTFSLPEATENKTTKKKKEKTVAATRTVPLLQPPSLEKLAKWGNK